MAHFPTPNKKAPLAGTSEASRDSFGGLSHTPSSLALQRAQFLMMAHAIRPDMAVMLAAMVFDGSAQ